MCYFQVMVYVEVERTINMNVFAVMAPLHRSGIIKDWNAAEVEESHTILNPASAVMASSPGCIFQACVVVEVNLTIHSFVPAVVQK